MVPDGLFGPCDEEQEAARFRALTTVVLALMRMRILMLQGAVIAQICMIVFFAAWAAVALGVAPWNVIAPWSLTGFGITWALLARGPIFSRVPRKLCVMSCRALVNMYHNTCMDDYARRHRLALRICDVYAFGVIIEHASLGAPALFLIAAFEVEHHIAALLSALVPVLFMLLEFPTYARSSRWVTIDLKSTLLLPEGAHNPYAGSLHLSKE
jgi:hypothetical protein